MVPYFREEAHLSKAQAAGVLSLSTVLALTNLAWSYLADKFTPRKTLVGALALAALTIVYLMTVSSLPSAYVFALLWGTSTAGIGTMEHMVIAQYFGRESYGSISGTLGPFQTAALGMGPTLGARGPGRHQELHRGTCAGDGYFAGGGRPDVLRPASRIALWAPSDAAGSRARG